MLEMKRKLDPNEWVWKQRVTFQAERPMSLNKSFLHNAADTILKACFLFKFLLTKNKWEHGESSC